MSFRKFTAPTARQALQEIRNELGCEAVILSNRNTDEGVEIIAVASESMLLLTGQEQEKIEQERIRNESAIGRTARDSADRQRGAKGNVMSDANPAAESPILGEIKSMRSMLQQQLAALSWTNMQQLDPQRAGLLRGMLNSGFSTLLASRLLDKMPIGNTNGESWIKQVLKLNLLIAGEAEDIVSTGGVYALVGPTGVGKTTTTAKLAARAVVRYGADKVALLTTDSYRIGAYDQLKIYGKILGVVVYAIKDADDLRLTISTLRDKHLVLIDTVGMGQRDERVANQSEMLDAAGVSRLLLLNAACDGNTLDDVVRMYYNSKIVGCIPTKLDEAVNIGMILDVAIRHRLMLHYMSNGQRVPEDLHPINLDYLLHRALRSAEDKTPFTLSELEFPLMMSAGASASPVEAAYAH